MMSFGVSGSSVTSVTVRHHYSLVPSQLSLFFFFFFFFFKTLYFMVVTYMLNAMRW